MRPDEIRRSQELSDFVLEEHRSGKSPETIRRIASRYFGIKISRELVTRHLRLRRVDGFFKPMNKSNDCLIWGCYWSNGRCIRCNRWRDNRTVTVEVPPSEIHKIDLSKSYSTLLEAGFPRVC